jgi:hypothetical protein
MLGASAFWGLVPLFARQNLGRGAAGYGVLLGFFGSGAVLGGSILPRLQRRLGIKRLLSSDHASQCRRARADGGVAPIPGGLRRPLSPPGFAWTSVLSTFNTSVQLNTAAWVRGRAMAFYQVTYFVGLGAGSALWGTVAEHVGIPRTLLVAALALALGLIAAARYPVGFGEGLNFEPTSRPIPVVVNEPEAEQGPVLVTVEYRIDPRRAAEFTLAMLELRPLSPAGRSRGLGALRGCRRAGPLPGDLRGRVLGRTPPPARPSYHGRPPNLGTRQLLPPP